VNSQLYALLVRETDHYSLAQLARAIANAPRKDRLPVWRAFVRTRGNAFAAETRTQRIRVRVGPRSMRRAG
jgi:hypothetical protein